MVNKIVPLGVYMKQVKATLKYGKTINGWRKKMLVVFTVMFLLFLCIMIAMPFILGKAYYEDKTIKFAIVSCIAGCAIGFLLFLTLAVCNVKRNRIISEWMKDAVTLKAKVKKCDIGFDLFGPNTVSVSFSYKKKKIVKRSGGNCFVGYPKIFLLFLGDNRESLYSPRYDEVMFV